MLSSMAKATDPTVTDLIWILVRSVFAPFIIGSAGRASIQNSIADSRLSHVEYSATLPRTRRVAADGAVGHDKGPMVRDENAVGGVNRVAVIRAGECVAQRAGPAVIGVCDYDGGSWQRIADSHQCFARAAELGHG